MVNLLHCRILLQPTSAQGSTLTPRSEPNVCVRQLRTCSRVGSGQQCANRSGNRPASLGIAEILGAALQTDGETRSAYAASSIRRRSSAWTILLDWPMREADIYAQRITATTAMYPSQTARRHRAKERTQFAPDQSHSPSRHNVKV